MKTVFALALATLCAGSQAALGTAILPDFSAATFVEGAPIDNIYFPLVPDTVFTYQGVEDGELITERLTVTRDTRTVLGIQTVVFREDAFEGDLLVETSFNFVAQDTNGNIWYFGEDSTEFIYNDEGELIDQETTGSWLAGLNGAMPGWLVQGNPVVTEDFFYQEFAPNDDALDQARVVALSQPISIGLGDFDALWTMEFNPIDEEYENKFYVAGLGLVLIEEGVGPDGTDEPGLVLELVDVTVIPEPMTGSLLALGAVGLLLRRRTWRGIGDR